MPGFPQACFIMPAPKNSFWANTNFGYWVILVWMDFWGFCNDKKYSCFNSVYCPKHITSIQTCCVVPSIICFLLGLLVFHCCHLNNMTWQEYCQLFLKLVPVFIAAIWIKRQPMKILESGSRSIPKTFQSLASLIWLEIKSWDSASSQDQKSLSLSGMSTYIHILLLPTIFATYSMDCQ